MSQKSGPEDGEDERIDNDQGRLRGVQVIRSFVTCCL